MATGSTQRTPIHADGPSSPERALGWLAARLAECGPVEPGSFLRLEARLDPCDVMAWLRTAPAGTRRYFRDRGSKIELAGVGIASTAAFGAHDRLRQSGAAGDRPGAWFVALPFDAARSRDAAWKPFDAVSCVLPAVELRREGEVHTLAVHVSADPDARAALPGLLDALAAPRASCVIEPALVRTVDASAESAWCAAVRGALERIRAGALRKIVLARTQRYAASGPLDAAAVLARLAVRESRGFRFMVEAGDGRAFVGITPERLASRAGRSARSEAVAGTRPRGVDAVADRLLGESLLASQKDRREQELVVERVREALAPIASSLRVDPSPRLLRLAYVQHLSTRVQAELRPGVSDLDLVRALHPTPAVAGAPYADAVAALREFEPFDRGLYAGPVGIVSRDGSEFAVAIRSARIDGDVLTAFAGAGIVDGSDPSDEWRETGHKLLAFERLAT
jgi:menaquinone-specific isochorismate synthase